MDEELVSLADVYAIDAVDDTERSEIDRRLEQADAATRAAFNETVATTRETLADLASGNEADPPARLRDSVLAIVHDESAADRSGRHAEPGTPVDKKRDAGGSPDNVVAMRPRSKRRTVLTRIAGIAAAVLIAAAGISVGYGFGQAGNQPSLQAEVLDASDAALHTADLPGGGQTTLVTSSHEDAAVVLLHDADKPPKKKVYQMWLMSSDLKHPRSVGIMNHSDIEPTTTELVKGVGDAGAFAITVEPDGGSEKPTTKPFSLIKFG